MLNYYVEKKEDNVCFVYQGEGNARVTISGFGPVIVSGDSQQEFSDDILLNLKPGCTWEIKLQS